MESVLLSPQSTKQINPIIMENNNELDNREEGESNYFHGCRKDANCNCKMCLDSITATLDLMSLSVQRSSLTKLSASKPFVDKTPVTIDPTLLSTPTSRSSPVANVDSSKPAIKSTANSRFSKNSWVKKKGLQYKMKFWWWALLFGLIVGFGFGFSRAAFWIWRPRLSDQMVKEVVEEFSNIENLSERLNLIQKSLNNSVGGRISNCIPGDSAWKINQDGLILLSYCNLYKSAVEEVFVRGWPLPTAGLLTAGFSPRSFNVLYGRITEWPEGKITFVVRETNMTWIQRKFSTSIVQFERNTWIIEYSRSIFLENPNIFGLTMEFIKLRIFIFMERIKQHCSILPNFRYYTTLTLEASGFNIPT